DGRAALDSLQPNQCVSDVAFDDLAARNAEPLAPRRNDTQPLKQFPRSSGECGAGVDDRFDFFESSTCQIADLQGYSKRGHPSSDDIVPPPRPTMRMSRPIASTDLITPAVRERLPRLQSTFGRL